MQRIKILVFVFFALFACAFYGYQFFTPSVVGQTGGTTLSAPTGVVASDNDYINKVGIHWDTIRGATAYRIFRNTVNNSATATDVGTTPANYYFDSTAVVSQNYFYWVRAENGSSVSSFSNPDQGVRANGTIVSESGPLEPPGAPAANPVTAAKAYLGKTLFWDEQLSSTKTMACGTCHQSGKGGSDPRTIFGNANTRNPGFDQTFGTADDVFGSRGVPRNNADGTYILSPVYGMNDQVTPRKAPSYLNAAYAADLFWDGRANSTFRDPITNAIIIPGGAGLESQVLGPPTSDAEMAHGGRNWTQVAARIEQSKPLALANNIPTALKTWINGRTYPQLFQEVYGSSDVTPAKIAMAIATHERTLFSDQTPWDRWSGNLEQLTPEETQGRSLFNTLQCNFCHSDALFADHNFHNIGVRPPSEDLGRAATTGIPEDAGKFKTPNLRNVELHAPYMHDGRFNTLEEVVEFYNRGGDHDAPNIDRNLIKPLGLATDEKAALVAFMKRPMTDLRVKNELPPFDRPHLFTESNRVPVISGTGRAGAGGSVPKVTAIEPPLLGNPSFTVAVSSALGNSQATLVINSTDPGVGTTIPASGSFLRQTITLQGSGNAGFGSIVTSIPNNPSLLGQTFYGRWYVTDASAASGFSVSQVFRFTIFDSNTVIPTSAAHVDFDGDRKTDVSIFRPSNGQWWYQRSGNNQVTALQFGENSDKLAPADYTGDGKTDIAIYRPSNGYWYILRSEDFSFYGFPFGASTDVPAPADYDGDGKADPTVFRASNSGWYSILSSNGSVSARTFGVNGDVPQVGDYDADGKADLAIFRPNGSSGGGEWWINRSTAGVVSAQFGAATDKPVAADYTGDGKMDMAFFRPSNGTWYVLRSEDFSFYGAPFGASSDVPAPGDYDGDGKADFSVFRSSDTGWYSLRSTQGLVILSFGANGDRPVPSAYVP